MEKVVLKANVRTTTTKTSTKTLRREGRVPGVFYSKHDQPVSIDVEENLIKPLVYTSEAHLISLQIDKEEHECVIKEVQFDPVTDKIIHFDLLGLTVGEKFQLEVPIQFHGSPIGVKEGGLLQTSLHKVEIECLPKDIPQHIDLNIQNLKLGDAIHVSDLNIEGITVLNPEDTLIVAVVHPKAEKEPAEEGAEEVPTEPEVVGKAKEEE